MIPRRPLAPGGPPVPTIGQGTWQMERDPRASVVRALQHGIELGLTHIDTAELYGDGVVETIVGRAIAGQRDAVYLVSKVLPTHASREGTVRACEHSLRRLETDRLDLYLLHWPGDYPLEDTIAAMVELERAGKIRAWGVSNFDVADLERAVRIAGPKRIACNQVLYHLDERGIEHAVAPWCARHGIAIVGYSPFGAGAFPSARTKRGQVLAEIAKELGATPRQVALAYLIRDPNFWTIPKASNPAHVEENAGAARLVLSDEIVSRIDAAFPRGTYRGLPTL
jgi:diketogulonate reductase-like aldo/keto reductase